MKTSSVYRAGALYKVTCSKAKDDMWFFFLIRGIVRSALRGWRHHTGNDGLAAGLKIDGGITRWVAITQQDSVWPTEAGSIRRGVAMRFGRNALLHL